MVGGWEQLTWDLSPVTVDCIAAAAKDFDRLSKSVKLNILDTDVLDANFMKNKKLGKVRVVLIAVVLAAAAAGQGQRCSYRLAPDAAQGSLLALHIACRLELS